MDQAKIAAAQQRVRDQGAKTSMSADRIEEMAQNVAIQAQALQDTGVLQHKHGGVLNTTVFESNLGPACRIQCTTRSNRQLTVQVYLA